MKKYSIVMIDDDKEFLEEFKTILTDEYFEVYTAINGKRGLELVKKIKPAIVLLDKKLPDGDGQTFMKTMKEHSKDSSFILVTAYADMESVVNGLRDGLADYIIKPIKPAVLLKQIYKALQNQAEKENEVVQLEKLIKSNEKYQIMDELKSTFVANVSHEIVGPLAILKDGLNITKSKIAENVDPFAKKSLEVCEKEVDRLVRFTRNMLSLSKIESGRMPCNKIKTNVKTIFTEIGDFIKPELDKNALKLSIKVESDNLSAYIDQDLFKEIIFNLINNSIKHSKPEQKIDLEATKHGKNILIEIKDEGDGIPSDDLPKIFDKYYRVFADKSEDTGLGLPLVKEMVELHGGTINVESKQNKGTKFIISLPMGE